MRQRYPDFQPESFTEERPIQGGKRLIEDDDIRLNDNNNEELVYTTQSRPQNPHPLLSGRNSFLDDLEREFNDMVNRQYTKEKRPYEYSNDKGKGPGGFPMRGSSSCNVGMPAKEPLFEPHIVFSIFVTDTKVPFDMKILIGSIVLVGPQLSTTLNE
jgi:hypothetical protein